MSTRFADERLSAYLDGELDDQERRAFERELERDGQLRAELDAMQAAVTMLHRHGGVRAPADFHARVLEAVADEPVPVPWWVWLRRPFGLPMEGLLVAAAAAAVLWVALPASEPGPVPEGVDPAAAKLKWADPEEAPAALDEKAIEKAEPAPPPKKEAPTKGLDVQTPKPIPSKKSTEELRTTPAGKPPAPTTPEANTAEATDAPAGTDDETDDDRLIGGHSYRISTSQPDAQFILQRIASRYQTVATNTDGTKLAGTEFENAGSLQTVVQIPYDVLAQFERDLRSLGVVDREYDDKLYRTEALKLTITLQLDGAPEKMRGVEAEADDMLQMKE